MSLIFATQFTATATLMLAILAHAAWRKQSNDGRGRAELRRSPDWERTS